MLYNIKKALLIYENDKNSVNGNKVLIDILIQAYLHVYTKLFSSFDLFFRCANFWVAQPVWLLLMIHYTFMIVMFFVLCFSVFPQFFPRQLK